MAEEPDWLRLQKKIFTRYVQQKLRQGGIKEDIKDIIQSVKDGIVLIQLLEVLSGKQFPGKMPAANPKSKIQMIDNASKALDFAIKTCGVKITASSENIVDGDAKLILGMIFQIILKFMKIDNDDDSPTGDVKEALMLWLKNKTAGYKGVVLENFTKSFHNGLPFAALIHKMRPKLIDYNSLDPNNRVPNLTLALDLGAKYCNVEKYLEPTDIPKLDEVSMIVYLSDWYYGVALLQKQDISAKRVGKLVIMTELHDKMRTDYTHGANALSDWVNAKIKELSKNEFDNTLEGVQRQIDQFYEYKSTEKSRKLSELLDVETLFDNLASRLQHNKRPPWKPSANISPEALDKKFEELERAELEKSKALHAEKARQIEIINDRMCKEFADAVKIFVDWLNGKKNAIKTHKGELEQQLADLEKSASEGSKADGYLRTIADHDEKIKARLITNNKFTAITLGDCKAMWTQFGVLVSKKKELLLSQIEEKKKSGLTDEQLQEIKDNFTYFDRDKTNYLDKKELRACMQSLGEDSTPKDVENVLKAYDKDGDGKIKFDEFQAFMFTKLGDTNSKEEIIQAFKYLSYDNDYIKVEHLVNVINDLSWKQRHVDYLKKEMKPKKDGLDYEKWTEEVFAR